MELADVPDSKSGGSDTVRVRPPPPAPKKRYARAYLFSSVDARRFNSDYNKIIFETSPVFYLLVHWLIIEYNS